MTSAGRAAVRGHGWRLDDGGLPPDLQALLRDHIQSYEQLEVLLWLRDRRQEAWSPDSLAGRLNLAESMTEEACLALLEHRLIEARGAPPQWVFQYRPESAAHDTAIGQLVVAYAEHRLDVVRAMNANALDRLRTKSLGVFSGAFLWKRSGGAPAPR